MTFPFICCKEPLIWELIDCVEWIVLSEDFLRIKAGDSNRKQYLFVHLPWTHHCYMLLKWSTRQCCCWISELDSFWIYHSQKAILGSREKHLLSCSLNGHLSLILKLAHKTLPATSLCFSFYTFSYSVFRISSWTYLLILSNTCSGFMFLIATNGHSWEKQSCLLFLYACAYVCEGVCTAFFLFLIICVCLRMFEHSIIYVLYYLLHVLYIFLTQINVHIILDKLLYWAFILVLLAHYKLYEI